VIKKQIPVESYFDKPKNPDPGYMEIDLVHHCGRSTKGDYCHTLAGVDVATGWAELRALRNRARIWTIDALDDIRRSVPFTISTWHSDNGSEFLNGHLVAYAEDRNIKLTRSRAYHKNDSPYVESRQWTFNLFRP